MAFTPEESFLHEIAKLHIQTFLNNILVIIVIFIHENNDYTLPVIDTIVYSPPSHHIHPDFVSSVFTHTPLFSNDFFKPIPNSDFFASLFSEHVKRDCKFSYVWLTFAQFNSDFFSSYSSTHLIKYKNIIKKINLTTQCYHSINICVDYSRLLEFSYAFIECWKIYGSLILFNPEKPKRLILPIHK